VPTPHHITLHPLDPFSSQAHRVLLSTDGPYDNVIKMKPPMVFGEEEADQVLATLR
jgi:4-aminobutyrate aminotransferase-like enzyme